MAIISHLRDTTEVSSAHLTFFFISCDGRLFKAVSNKEKVFDMYFGTDAAVLHKSADGRTSPTPGQTHPTTFVTGMPRAV